MSCVGVGVVVGGVHDIMYSCGDVWYGYGRSRELNGCVRSGRVGAVPQSVVIMVLNGWKGRGMNQTSPDSVQ